MSLDHIGKRIKSPQEETIKLRFPTSDQIETLPAGKPSGKITSFVINSGSKFWQIDENKYLKDSDRLKFVDDDAEDESGYLAGALFAIKDLLSNTGQKAENQAGYLKDGITKTAAEMKSGFFNISDSIKPILILVAGIMLLMLFRDITSIFKK